MSAQPAARPAALPPTLARASALVEQPLRDAIASLAPAVHGIVMYHFGWADERGRPASGSGGKALRAALALLSAEAAGGPGAAERDGIPAAVAVQLVHEFSLLHDDIMDGDRTRRHRPTAWTVFGSGPALLAGDALCTRAVEVLALAAPPASAGPAVAALVRAIQELITGQAADLSLEARVDAGLDETLTMAEQKTGALLGVSAALGAMLAGGSPPLVAALERYGRTLGLAFQLVDDLLGIWGDPAVTGKPVFADLRARKMSVPVAAALRGDEEASRELRGRLAGGGPADEQALALAAKLIDEAGGRSWTEREADRLAAAAVDALDGVPVAADVREDLAALARFTVRREL
ncbi:MAG TPA: polyprenyl synthetase family protein [Mycobacteriales bacterium]|nr:polyprenyl synthetase family protein [Mycobacteriales bacterium]